MTTKTKAGKLLVTIKEYLMITLGLLLYTLAWAVFLLPNNLVGGGITGLGSVIQYSTGFNIAYSYIIINAILVIADDRRRERSRQRRRAAKKRAARARGEG